MRRFLYASVFLLLASSSLAVDDVASTLHNLSSSGTSEFKSLTADEICAFCHTPHVTAPESPRWNRGASGRTFTEYGSSTSKAVRSQPRGSSLLCLSCHDGTVALGDVAGRLRGNDRRATFLQGRANLSTDLTDDHPVTIDYDSALQAANPELVHPSVIDLPLEEGRLECNSCHNPHSSDFPPFLHKTTQNGELCTSCHVRGGANWDWASSSHATSGAVPRGVDPWPERKPEWKGASVSDNACHNCHTPHNASSRARLIKDPEEETCYRCHNGTVANTDIESDMLKFSHHPVENTPNLDHDAAAGENPLTMPLHIECSDCHNPHAVRDDLPMISFDLANPLSPNHSVAPDANGRLAGIDGLDINGILKPEVDYQYEVCFKCHGVPGRSACDNDRCRTATIYSMVRQDGVYNIRDKVDPGNPTLVSWHPIDINNPANDSEVPSLRTDIPLNRGTSRIYCTDCHGSENSPSGGGIGPTGPHGSDNEPMLVQRYTMNPEEDFFDQGTDRLCFNCHDESSIFNDDSFGEHDRHVRNRGFSCINCHDPHGSAAFPHLINFLTSSRVSGSPLEITGAGSFTEPTWIDDGQYRGTCWLSCHGEVHDGWSY